MSEKQPDRSNIMSPSEERDIERMIEALSPADLPSVNTSLTSDDLNEAGDEATIPMDLDPRDTLLDNASVSELAHNNGPEIEGEVGAEDWNTNKRLDLAPPPIAEQNVESLTCITNDTTVSTPTSTDHAIEESHVYFASDDTGEEVGENANTPMSSPQNEHPGTNDELGYRALQEHGLAESDDELGFKELVENGLGYVTGEGNEHTGLRASGEAINDTSELQNNDTPASLTATTIQTPTAAENSATSGKRKRSSLDIKTTDAPKLGTSDHRGSKVSRPVFADGTGSTPNYMPRLVLSYNAQDLTPERKRELAKKKTLLLKANMTTYKQKTIVSPKWLLEHFPDDATKEGTWKAGSVMRYLTQEELGWTDHTYERIFAGGHHQLNQLDPTRYTVKGQVRQRKISEATQSRDSTTGRFGAARRTDDAKKTMTVLQAIYKALEQPFVAGDIGLKRLGANIKILVDLAKAKARRDVEHEAHVESVWNKINGVLKPYRKCIAVMKNAFDIRDHQVMELENALDEANRRLKLAGLEQVKGPITAHIPLPAAPVDLVSDLPTSTTLTTEDLEEYNKRLAVYDDLVKGVNKENQRGTAVPKQKQDGIPKLPNLNGPKTKTTPSMMKSTKGKDVDNDSDEHTATSTKPEKPTTGKRKRPSNKE